MKFGIAVPDLLPSQLSYLIITRVNAWIKEHPKDDIIVFVENIEKHCLPAAFAVMDISEIWGYYNPVIATTLSTAEKILNCPSIPKKSFYCWDLEWIRLKQKQFENLSTIYRNHELSIVTRSFDHLNIFESCWNRNVDMICDDFDIPKIGELLSWEKSPS